MWFCVVSDAVSVIYPCYFLRFFNGGKPLSNSDVDKLIDLDTNLARPAAGRFMPFFFTVFESVTRSVFLVVDLKREKRKNEQQEIEISSC